MSLIGVRYRVLVVGGAALMLAGAVVGRLQPGPVWMQALLVNGMILAGVLTILGAPLLGSPASSRPTSSDGARTARFAISVGVAFVVGALALQVQLGHVMPALAIPILIGAGLVLVGWYLTSRGGRLG